MCRRYRCRRWTERSGSGQWARQRPLAAEWELATAEAGEILKQRHAIVVDHTATGHDPLHYAVAARVLGNEAYVMTYSSSFSEKAKGNQIASTHVFKGGTKPTANVRLSFCGRSSGHFQTHFAQPFWAEQGLHVRGHQIVLHAHVDAVVIEEEDALAPEILDDRADEAHR